MLEEPPLPEETKQPSEIDVINTNLDAYLQQLVTTFTHVNDNHLPNFFENQIQMATNMSPNNEGSNH